VFHIDDEVPAPPVIADVNGSGPGEVLVSTAGQVFALDGQAGGVTYRSLAAGKGADFFNHKAAAVVGEFGPGRWALVSTGFTHGGDGRIDVYDIPKPTSLAWGQYRKNALRVGGDPIGPIVYDCTMGYRLTGSDGGIFSYGTAQYYGSTGAIRLAQPIVGMTATRKGDGYWFVASDGGVFNYGSAGFYGSSGNIKLNLPVKGMAAHPQGKGYWLVASDGGIFNYGDAKFYGSTGAMTLNSPIVGMAASQSGDGYWLVAADGGIFSFGGAQFYGSAGGLRLAKPIVGMQPTANGQGYWFVANDGGIFNYGNAQFCGSAARLRLSAPIVGMT
jgi:ribosomal protein L24E